MAQNSNIEWTDHTFNPWIGCTKVSPGCANCYAETLMDTRYGRVKWGKGNPRQRTSAANWKQPLKWNREALEKWRICPLCEWRGAAEEKGHRCGNYKCRYIGKLIQARPRVFCASLADWLDDEVPIEWLADLLKLIHDTPNLDWLLLTKRPENWAARIEEAHDWMRNEELEETDLSFLKAENPSEYKKAIALRDTADWLRLWLGGSAPHNIRIGTTVEDQKRADERIPELLKIPAKVRFLSCEPLLQELNIVKAGALGCSCESENRCSGSCPHYRHAVNKSERGIHWVICGGESGPNARPMHPDWARSLRDQCVAAGVPFFFKQWGEFAPVHAQGIKGVLVCSETGEFFDAVGQHSKCRGSHFYLPRIGKKADGRLLDGREWNEFPTP